MSKQSKSRNERAERKEFVESTRHVEKTAEVPITWFQGLLKARQQYIIERQKDPNSAAAQTALDSFIGYADSAGFIIRDK